MNYYIGGPARNGKSFLAERVRKHTDGERIHCDALKIALKEVVTPDTHPDIFEKAVDPIHYELSPDAWVDRLYRRDQALWPYFQAFIKARNTQAPQIDQIIEGNVWPDSLQNNSVEAHLARRAVFLIDTSPASDQQARLKAICDSPTGENNWMRTYSDDKLARWVVYNLARSRRYQQQCENLGFVYFDLADEGIEVMSDRAFAHLLQKAV